MPDSNSACVKPCLSARSISSRKADSTLSLFCGAKIAVADGGHTDIDLALVEAGLHNGLDAEQAARALEADVERITLCALDTVRLAGLKPGQLGALYFTGGSTGLTLLTDALQAAFPGARAVRGDRLASVATGLGLYAGRLFKD